MLFAQQVFNSQKQLFISKLDAAIAGRYQDPRLKMAELAFELAMCERQLSRHTKHFIGQTPGEYLRKYRLNQARKLLREGASAKLSAYYTGFSSYGYFARCFKAEFGYTTKQWRKAGEYNKKLT